MIVALILELTRDLVRWIHHYKIWTSEPGRFILDPVRQMQQRNAGV